MVKKETSRRKPKPAADPEAREKQLINLAVNLAERQLEEGTASSAVITHFLKLGTVQAKVELEKAKAQNTLLTAKADSINDEKTKKQTVMDVQKALKSYDTTSDGHE